MKKKILIADDSKYMRMALFALLKDNFDIVMSENVATTISQYINESPDIVLLDIIIPGEGSFAGIGILKKILEINPRAIVIMMSAVSVDSVISECKSIGAKDYIVKTLDEKQVLATISKYI